jgi:UDP-glucose 6-dehydrogenase
MFKVGDGVVCIDEDFTDYLKKGEVYIVSAVIDSLLSVKGKENISFYHERFKRIEDNAVNRILYPEIDWGNNED